MNYRSVGDISITVNKNLHKIPDDIDLVVGIPRSGLLAGSVVALALNVPIVTMAAYAANQEIAHGGTRSIRNRSPRYPADAGHVLIVDDSIRTGESMTKAASIAADCGYAGERTTCAVYLTGKQQGDVDICLERVASPRAFEWNIFHTLVDQCCVDIDGVLCVDPTNAVNDDGPKYREFLLKAELLMRPTSRIGVIVTSRLEKYRPETEEWLGRQNITYDHLAMVNAPDAATRRKKGLFAKHKAEVYSRYPGMHLFIESDPRQSAEIARLTGRPVLCFPEQRIYEPGMSLKRVDAGARNYLARGFRRAQRIFRRSFT